MQMVGGAFQWIISKAASQVSIGNRHTLKRVAGIAMSLELVQLTFPVSILVFACTVASYTDIKDQVIPNWISYGMLIVGLAFHGVLAFMADEEVAAGSASMFASGIREGLVGTVVCFSVFFPLWLLGTMGGGDVKFVSALGMIVGPIVGLKIILIGCFIAALFVYVTRLVRKASFVFSSSSSANLLVSDEDSNDAIPMAGFLSLATLIALLSLLLS